MTWLLELLALGLSGLVLVTAMAVIGWLMFHWFAFVIDVLDAIMGLIADAWHWWTTE